MHLYLNKANFNTWQNLPITKKDNGGGSYTLSWTVPAGALRYQIKYSDKQIVEWLGFNKATRLYQYDPSQYTAFFAAKNISNNPVPAAVGTTQSITLSGLSTAQTFAAKYQTGVTPSALKAPSAPFNLRGGGVLR